MYFIFNYREIIAWGAEYYDKMIHGTIFVQVVKEGLCEEVTFKLRCNNRREQAMDRARRRAF